MSSITLGHNAYAYNLFVSNLGSEQAPVQTLFVNDSIQYTSNDLSFKPIGAVGVRARIDGDGSLSIGEDIKLYSGSDVSDASLHRFTVGLAQDDDVSFVIRDEVRGIDLLKVNPLTNVVSGVLAQSSSLQSPLSVNGIPVNAAVETTFSGSVNFSPQMLVSALALQTWWNSVSSSLCFVGPGLSGPSSVVNAFTSPYSTINVPSVSAINGELDKKMDKLVTIVGLNPVSKSVLGRTSSTLGSDTELLSSNGVLRLFHNYNTPFLKLTTHHVYLRKSQSFSSTLTIGSTGNFGGAGAQRILQRVRVRIYFNTSAFEFISASPVRSATSAFNTHVFSTTTDGEGNTYLEITCTSATGITGRTDVDLSYIIFKTLATAIPGYKSFIQKCLVEELVSQGTDYRFEMTDFDDDGYYTQLVGISTNLLGMNVYIQEDASPALPLVGSSSGTISASVWQYASGTSLPDEDSRLCTARAIKNAISALSSTFTTTLTDYLPKSNPDVTGSLSIGGVALGSCAYQNTVSTITELASGCATSSAVITYVSSQISSAITSSQASPTFTGTVTIPDGALKSAAVRSATDTFATTGLATSDLPSCSAITTRLGTVLADYVKTTDTLSNKTLSGTTTYSTGTFNISATTTFSGTCNISSGCTFSGGNINLPLTTTYLGTDLLRSAATCRVLTGISGSQNTNDILSAYTTTQLMASYAPLASPTFSGTCALPATVTIGGASVGTCATRNVETAIIAGSTNIPTSGQIVDYVALNGGGGSSNRTFDNTTLTVTTNLTGTVTLPVGSYLNGVALTSFATQEMLWLRERYLCQSWWSPNPSTSPSTIDDCKTVFGISDLGWPLMINGGFAGSTNATGSGACTVPSLYYENLAGGTNYVTSVFTIPALVTSLTRYVWYTSVPVQGNHLFRLTLNDQACFRMYRANDSDGFTNYTSVFERAVVSTSTNAFQTVSSSAINLLRGNTYKFVLLWGTRSTGLSTSFKMEMRLPGIASYIGTYGPNPIIHKQIFYTCTATVGTYTIAVPTDYKIETNRPSVIVTCEAAVFRTATCSFTASQTFIIRTYDAAGAAANSAFSFVVMSRGDILFNGRIGSAGAVQYETSFNYI